jgi:heme oxygenase
MVRLRFETTAEHIAIERSVPLMKSDLTKEEYVPTIGKIYQFVQLWEESAAVEAPGWLREMLVARRRSSLLLGDLERLNVLPTRARACFCRQRPQRLVSSALCMSWRDQPSGAN